MLLFSAYSPQKREIDSGLMTPNPVKNGKEKMLWHWENLKYMVNQSLCPFWD